MIQKVTLIFLLAWFPLLGSAQQTDDAPSRKELRKSRPAYIGISWGPDFCSFRDLATSPRYYYGALHSFSLETIRSDAHRLAGLGLRAQSGTSNSGSGGFSEVTSLSLQYQRLYRVWASSPERWNFKLGGAVNLSSNQRINRSLGNAGRGLELFANLMGTGRVQWDISRKEAKRKKFLFIKYDLPQRSRSLAFQFNAGIMNNNYRNGFAYLAPSTVLTENGPYDGFQWSLFSGVRMGTTLEYTSYLKNGNGLRVSWIWDAYTTGGEYSQFAMGHNIFQLSFLFNTK